MQKDAQTTEKDYNQHQKTSMQTWRYLMAKRAQSNNDKTGIGIFKFAGCPARMYNEIFVPNRAYVGEYPLYTEGTVSSSIQVHEICFDRNRQDAKTKPHRANDDRMG